MTGAYRRPSRSSHRLITSDDPCKSLAQGEVRYFASMLDVAKAFAKTPEPYKQIVYDDGCEVRHLNRDETWTGVRLRLPRPRRRGGRLMPIRLCLEPRCPNPATARGRCDEHRKPIERERSRARRAATNGVYKRRKWELTRRAVLARDPICKVCDNALSTEVDHTSR